MLRIRLFHRLGLLVPLLELHRRIATPKVEASGSNEISPRHRPVAD